MAGTSRGWCGPVRNRARVPVPVLTPGPVVGGRDKS